MGWWTAVPIAIEPKGHKVASKEADFDRARVKNYERVEELATQGHRFRNFLEQEGCWYWEVFGFLKGQSRVIALADYSVEKTFVRELSAINRLIVADRDLVMFAQILAGQRRTEPVILFLSQDRYRLGLALLAQFAVGSLSPPSVDDRLVAFGWAMAEDLASGRLAAGKTARR